MTIDRITARRGGGTTGLTLLEYTGTEEAGCGGGFRAHGVLYELWRIEDGFVLLTANARRPLKFCATESDVTAWLRHRHPGALLSIVA